VLLDWDSVGPGIGGTGERADVSSGSAAVTYFSAAANLLGAVVAAKS
jgi:hypothetical protein